MQNSPYQVKIFGHNFGTKMQHGADYGQKRPFHANIERVSFNCQHSTWSWRHPRLRTNHVSTSQHRVLFRIFPTSAVAPAARLSGRCLRMLLRLWSRRLSLTAWTTVINFCMASPTTCSDAYKPSKMPRHVWSQVCDDLSTLRQFWGSSIGCQSDNVYTSNWLSWCLRLCIHSTTLLGRRLSTRCHYRPPPTAIVDRQHVLGRPNKYVSPRSIPRRCWPETLEQPANPT